MALDETRRAFVGGGGIAIATVGPVSWLAPVLATAHWPLAAILLPTLGMFVMGCGLVFWAWDADRATWRSKKRAAIKEGRSVGRMILNPETFKRVFRWEGSTHMWLREEGKDGVAEAFLEVRKGMNDPIAWLPVQLDYLEGLKRRRHKRSWIAQRRHRS